MNKILNALCIVLGTFFVSQVFATTADLNQWGTVATVASGTCTDGNNCSLEDIPFILGITPVAPPSHGMNMLTAETGPISTAQGSAQSSSKIKTTELATPILKAKASSTAESYWIGAGAFAIQGYEYTGQENGSVEFTISFHGINTNPDGDDATGFGVGMYLFSPDQIDFASLTHDPFAVLGNLSLSVNNPLIDFPDEQVYELEFTQTGEVTTSGKISILSLDPGDQFYLAGGVLAAAGGNGAVANAYSTLTVDVDPDSPLIAASIAVVPLPPAAWMFMSALLGLAGMRRSNILQST